MAAGAVDQDFFVYIMEAPWAAPELPQTLPKLSQGSPRTAQGLGLPPEPPGGNFGGVRARMYTVCQSKRFLGNTDAFHAFHAFGAYRGFELLLGPPLPHTPGARMT